MLADPSVDSASGEGCIKSCLARLSATSNGGATACEEREESRTPPRLGTHVRSTGGSLAWLRGSIHSRGTTPTTTHTLRLFVVSGRRVVIKQEGAPPCLLA